MSTEEGRPAMTGGCQCGAVRYEVRASHRNAYVCHCRECRKQSAGAFGITFPVRKDDLSLTGTLDVYRRPAESGATTACYFCPKCGTRLYHEDERSGGILSLKAGTLDRPEPLEIVAELWTCRKLNWVKIAGKPECFDTQPEDLQAWRARILPAV